MLFSYATLICGCLLSITFLFLFDNPFENLLKYTDNGSAVRPFYVPKEGFAFERNQDSVSKKNLRSMSVYFIDEVYRQDVGRKTLPFEAPRESAEVPPIWRGFPFDTLNGNRLNTNNIRFQRWPLELSKEDRPKAPTKRQAFRLLDQQESQLGVAKSQFPQSTQRVSQSLYFFENERKNLLQKLDQLSFRAIGIGFPFLTIGILSGSVWANEAWGSYWNWDPKETWSLITWIIFAIYLHLRFTKNWDGLKSAILATIGFLSIWVCFLGVNFLAKGLHSYGWFH